MFLHRQNCQKSSHSSDSHLLLVDYIIKLIVFDNVLDDSRPSVMGSLVVSPIHGVVSHEVPLVEAGVHLLDHVFGEC